MTLHGHSFGRARNQTAGHVGDQPVGRRYVSRDQRLHQAVKINHTEEMRDKDVNSIRAGAEAERVPLEITFLCR